MLPRPLSLAALAVTVIAAAACDRTGPGPAIRYQPNDSTMIIDADSALLSLATQVMRVGDKVDEVWPDFWNAERAFILIDRGHAALLVTPVAPPDGYVRLAGKNVPRELLGYAYIRRGGFDEMEGAFNTNFPAGEVSAVALAMSDNQTERQMLETLFHEAFHEYQSHNFTKAGMESDYVDPDDVTDPSFGAMAAIEREILADALELSDDTANALLRSYLAVRSLRMSSASPALRGAELSLERKEGSAHLVGLLIGGLVSGPDQKAAGERLLKEMSEPMDLATEPLAQSLVRWRVYGTGATIGLLLDRMKYEWRSELRSGKSFEEILARAVKYSDGDAAELTSAAFSTYDLTEHVNDMGQAIAGTDNLTFEKFYAMAPLRFVIKLIAPIRNGTTEAASTFTSGEVGMVMLGESAMAIPDAEIFEWRTTTAKLIAKSLPILQDMRHLNDGSITVPPDNVPIHFIIPTNDLPSSIGGILTTMDTQQVENLTLQYGGLSLTIRGRATVQRAGAELIIQQGG